MSGLFRFIAKLFGRGPTVHPLTPRQADAPQVASPAADLGGTSFLPPSAPAAPAPDAHVILLDLAEDEDIGEDLEDESDEPDPTIGRYEELRVPILDAGEIVAQRAAFEAEGLSGPQKVFPHDPAGPGSLAETLARLEAEGRVISRVCDDAENGFYVLYEPARPASDP
jgi:hypothetical protein